MRLGMKDARRLAVEGAHLSAPKPASILEVTERLTGLQIDPTAVVARSEHLVLWSRLGPYDTAELDRLRFDEHRLFEYVAFIVPRADYAIHRETMRRSPRGDSTRAVYVRAWLKQNAAFRGYVLRELRRRGPLRSRELEDRAVVAWQTTGWNDGKNVSMMLERLWYQGRIAIVGREGQERIWDLAERVYPVGDRLPAAEVARRVLDRKLRLRGVARPRDFNYTFDGRPPGWERALRSLVADGVAVPVEVADRGGEWFAHRDGLAALDSFKPRTTLLSPFDPLIAPNRDRTQELFDFAYKLEIYVPKAKREHGYYVLPVLQGDRLVGRVDPELDRRENVLRLHAVHWEDDPVDIGRPLADLARWLGAESVVHP
jgi:hypothetical protein